MIICLIIIYLHFVQIIRAFTERQALIVLAENVLQNEHESDEAKIFLHRTLHSGQRYNYVHVYDLQ